MLNHSTRSRIRVERGFQSIGDRQHVVSFCKSAPSVILHGESATLPNTNHDVPQGSSRLRAREFPCPSRPTCTTCGGATRTRTRSPGERLLKGSMKTPLAAHLSCVLAIATLAFGSGTVEAFIPSNLFSGGGSLGHSHEEITTNEIGRAHV